MLTDSAEILSTHWTRRIPEPHLGSPTDLPPACARAAAPLLAAGPLRRPAAACQPG